jgi:hypothetical protein
MMPPELVERIVEACSTAGGYKYPRTEDTGILATLAQRSVRAGSRVPYVSFGDTIVREY